MPLYKYSKHRHPIMSKEDYSPIPFIIIYLKTVTCTNSRGNFSIGLSRRIIRRKLYIRLLIQRINLSSALIVSIISLLIMFKRVVGTCSHQNHLSTITYFCQLHPKSCNNPSEEVWTNITFYRHITCYFSTIEDGFISCPTRIYGSPVTFALMCDWSSTPQRMVESKLVEDVAKWKILCER